MSSAGRNTGADPSGIKQSLIKLKTEKKEPAQQAAEAGLQNCENQGAAGQTASRRGARAGIAELRQRQEAPLTPRGRSGGGAQLAGIGNRTKPSKENSVTYPQSSQSVIPAFFRALSCLPDPRSHPLYSVCPAHASAS